MSKKKSAKKKFPYVSPLPDRAKLRAVNLTITSALRAGLLPHVEPVNGRDPYASPFRPSAKPKDIGGKIIPTRPRLSEWALPLLAATASTLEAALHEARRKMRMMRYR